MLLFWLGVGDVEDIARGLFGDLAAHDGDGFGQRDVFWADLDTVLGIGAIGDASLFHEDSVAFVGDHFACGIEIEKAHL